MSQFAVIEAPSILGLRPTGVEKLPEALIRAGLIDRLRARHAGRVAPQTPYDFERDSATLTLNAAGIASYSRALADLVGEVMDRGEFPVVLGGDCSILLGNLLALKRRGSLRTAIHGWPRRLLQSGGKPERRSGVHGAGARHGPWSRHSDEHRRSRPARERSRRRRVRVPRYRGASRTRKSATPSAAVCDRSPSDSQSRRDTRRQGCRRPPHARSRARQWFLAARRCGRAR